MSDAKPLWAPPVFRQSSSQPAHLQLIRPFSPLKSTVPPFPSRSRSSKHGWTRTRRYLLHRSPSHQSQTANTTVQHAGGKAKPLKQPKKEKKDLDEDEVAYKAKQAADAKARKDMADKAKGKGPLNAGQQGKNLLLRLSLIMSLT